MSNIAFSIKDRLRMEYREKKFSRFANRSNQKNLNIVPKEITGRHSKVKHICIVCLKNPVREFYSGIGLMTPGSNKHCEECFKNIKPAEMIPCIRCSGEFAPRKKNYSLCEPCFFRNRNGDAK